MNEVKTSWKPLPSPKAHGQQSGFSVQKRNCEWGEAPRHRSPGKQCGEGSSLMEKVRHTGEETYPRLRRTRGDGRSRVKSKVI